MRKFALGSVTALLAGAACAEGVPGSPDRPGGAATVAVTAGVDAFSQPAATLAPGKALDFHVGRGLFHKDWVAAPSDTPASDGLGPLYNARACAGCHIRDGRGHPPAGPSDDAVSMVLRIAIPTASDAPFPEIAGHLATRPDPTYGAQLQDLATPGVAPEHSLSVTYAEKPVTLADGTQVSLRHPTYRARGLSRGPLHPEAVLSPRVAPQMIGMGLLEAIPAEAIRALADPDDRDGDGVSGRANMVWSRAFGRLMLGRFGLKAGSATVLDQTASAFADDMGLSNPLFPQPYGDCTPVQRACVAAPHGGDEGFEIGAEGLAYTSFYSATLGVPARRNGDAPKVRQGEALFHTAGCAACHQPGFAVPGGEDGPQRIWPYTDMLLHDMGPGLADGFPEGRATGREWRTPPLWGIGLTRQVSGHTFFLHDGRARSLLEAILWHGGEAQSARDTVAGMSADNRDALIAFLESL